MKKIVFFWIGLFCFNVLIRSYQITSIPSFVVSDEIQYLAEAQALAIAGTDLSGTWSPWQLTSSNSWYAELPSTVLLPAIHVFSYSPLFSAKITHILMGSLLPLLLAGIVHALFKNQKMAIITALIATCNPWLFQFSRLAFESFFSIFFYILGMYLFLTLSNWKKLLAVVPFFLGFFQYQGHKLLLVPFVFILVLYTFYDRVATQEKRRMKLSANELAALSLLVLAVLMTGSFALRLPNQEAGKRTSHIYFMSDKQVTDDVIRARRLSFENPAQQLFINKASVVIDDMIVKYVGSFSPVYLFVGGGNSSDSWAVTSKGKLYLLDAILIIFGFGLFRKKEYRKGLLLLTGLLVVSPLPAMLPEGPLWSTFRAAFIVPILIMVAGAGMWSISQLVSKRLFVIFVVLYGILIIPFFYDYFYRYPMYSTGDTYFYNRVIASYLKRIEPTEKVLLLGDETRHLFSTILFYNQWLNRSSFSAVSAALKEGTYRYQNFEAQGSCFDPALLSKYSVVMMIRNQGFCASVDESAPAVRDRLSIVSLIDSGEVVKVYGDRLCSQYPLDAYSRVSSNVFAVEKLSDEEFCRNFFIRYR